MSFENQLVKAVKRKREAQGLSIRSLATEVGISFSSLARIERGEGSPDHNSQVRLLEWLGEDADAAGLGFDRVALVHFRAMKNARSSTVRHLLIAADCLRRKMSPGSKEPSITKAAPHEAVSLSKDELESVAAKFRADLGISKDSPIDPLKLQVEGIDVVGITTTDCLDPETVSSLSSESCDEWSAMSVPLDLAEDLWVVLLNDCHTLERQRVTVLEEYWHILLGHRLTRVARIGEAYGRTYDKIEEHDAYYLASATLLPMHAVAESVTQNLGSGEIARRFGTSPELVDYRIKRLGLWREHVGKIVILSDNS